MNDMNTYEPKVKSYKIVFSNERSGECIIKEISLPLALLRLYSCFGYQEIKSIEEMEEAKND